MTPVQILITQIILAISLSIFIYKIIIGTTVHATFKEAYLKVACHRWDIKDLRNYY